MVNFKTPLEYLEEQDRLYPNRHKEIHKGCCKNCPSNNNKKAEIIDPEANDIKNGVPKEMIALEYLFVCAWRPDKLCKGVCDYYEIDEKFIEECHNRRGRKEIYKICK